MADKRAFAKFDVGYLDNPKVEPILDANPNAVLMHIASVLYCAQHLTDGEIAMRAMQRRVGGSSEDARALLDAGLWHEAGHDCPSCPQPADGKVFVHDYLEHNRTSDGVKRKSIAGRKGAQVRWEGDANGMPTASESHATTNADRNAESPEPQWLEREKEREREREEDTSDSGESDDIRGDVQEVIDHMVAALEANDVRKSKMGKSWHNAARLLIDKDGYTVEQIKWITTWATSHHFWKSNILSMPKLREKFDQLKLQATTERPTSNIDQRRAENVQRISQRQPWSPDQQDPNQWGGEEVRALGR